MTEELLPKEIYLLVGEGDEGSTIWCDHIPNDEMNAVKYTRAQPKYKRVDFVHIQVDVLNHLGLVGLSTRADLVLDALDYIKSKYGDLYV